MSAIAGIFNLDGRPVEQVQVQDMTDTVAHRGPDGVGHWVDGPLGLGHLMLRTTPESLQEHQPLALEEGNYVITCDGRLDNREEVIQALGCNAPNYVKAPDAELILRAYMAWGTNCVKRIVGDFAFAVWDRPRRQLFCARDPIGIRIFHYYFDGRRFLFGTEIKEILADASVPRKLNEARLGMALTVMSVDVEQTFYEGINRLPGGHSMLVTPQGIQQQVYWDPDPSDQLKLASDEEYEEQFSYLLRQAVRTRMRSTGPVGVLLSGGLDSSAVFCTAESLRREKDASLPEVQYLSAVFPVLKEVDETEYIDEIVDMYQSTGHRLPSDEFWGMKPVKGRGPRDEPFSAPYEVRSRELYKLSKDAGVRVLLDGQGGDEVLWAWDVYLMDLFRGLHFRKFYQETRHFTRAGKREIIMQSFASLVPGPVGRLKERWWNPLSPSWIDARFARRIKLKALIGQLTPPPKYRSLYAQYQHDLIELRGRRPALMWRDVTAAEFEIEPRHPFWDTRLLEFLVRTPPQQKYQKRYTKSLLRRTMRDVLPERIRTRRGKTRLAPLFNLGVSQHEVGRLERTLEDPLLARLGYVDAKELRQALRQVGKSDTPEKEFLFATLTLEEWLQENLGRQWGEAYRRPSIRP